MMTTSPTSITILYGSQTGNAEDMAKRVGLQARLMGYHQVLVEAMDDFQLKELPKQKLVIFICSTTGHGQEPENMKNLFNFIRRRDLPANCLSRLSYVVYGLGDSSYAKFNYVAKILFKRLRECGAQPIQELVASDEQHQFGCDGVIYPKLEELWQIIDARRIGSIDIKKNSYSVTLYTDEDETRGPEDKFNDKFKTKYNMLEAVCMRNARITHESHFQDTRFLCFRSEHHLDYEPGDVCTIHPQNSEENIEAFLQLLNLNPKQKFRLEKLNPNYMVNYLYDFIPDGLTVGDLIRYYLDIQSVPKRSFFEHLWPFSDDNLERAKLMEFASTEGQEEVYEYCIRPKRSILETLMDFPHTIKKIKFESLFDMIPPIKPRSFSIASAASVHPKEIHLIVGIVSYKTIMKKPRQGLCSNYLARMEPVHLSDGGLDSAPESSLLRFFIRKSSFKLPGDNGRPIIMVGPGLGIAPFRSFIEERRHQLEHNEDLKMSAAGANHLYFGCRFEDKDFYLEQQLQGWANDSIIRLRVAFSRHQPKQYVQDLLIQDAELTRRLVQDEGALLYVAGNSKLPEELRGILAQILVPSSQAEQAGESSSSVLASTEGEKIVATLEATNRIQYDCW